MVFTDNFSTGSDQNLDARSGWSATVPSGYDHVTVVASSGSAVAVNAGFCAGFVSGTFSNDQYAQGVITGGGGFNRYAGLGLWLSASAENNIILLCKDDGNSSIWFGSTPQTLDTGSLTAPNGAVIGDTIKLTVVGSTIYIYINGTEKATKSTSGLTPGGAPGIVGFGAANTGIDNFEGGDFSTSSTRFVMSGGIFRINNGRIITI